MALINPCSQKEDVKTSVQSSTKQNKVLAVDLEIIFFDGHMDTCPVSLEVGTVIHGSYIS